MKEKQLQKAKHTLLLRTPVIVSKTRADPSSKFSSLLIQVLQPVSGRVGRGFLGNALQEVEGLLKHLQQELLELSRDAVLGQQLVDTAHGEDAQRVRSRGTRPEAAVEAAVSYNETRGSGVHWN